MTISIHYPHLKYIWPYIIRSNCTVVLQASGAVCIVCLLVGIINILRYYTVSEAHWFVTFDTPADCLVGDTCVVLGICMNVYEYLISI